MWAPHDEALTVEAGVLIPSWRIHIMELSIGLHMREPSWWHKEFHVLPSCGLYHLEPSFRNEGSTWWSTYDGIKSLMFSCHEGFIMWKPHSIMRSPHDRGHIPAFWLHILEPACSYEGSSHYAYNTSNILLVYRTKRLRQSNLCV